MEILCEMKPTNRTRHAHARRRPAPFVRALPTACVSLHFYGAVDDLHKPEAREEANRAWRAPVTMKKAYEATIM